eukprot:29398-Pelagococcus_subviridis.AAC.5
MACSNVRGNPSINTHLFEARNASISSRRNLSTISVGTSAFATRIPRINAPTSVSLSTPSSPARLRTSPTRTWTYSSPRSAASFAHCVATPAPGPPMANTTRLASGGFGGTYRSALALASAVARAAIAL